METIKKQSKSQKGQAVLNLTEDQARQYIEKMMWPNGEPVCPSCGSINAYRMKGASCRPGLCRCRDCKRQFTVTVGTIFEDSHLPLATWVKAIHMMASSKKGISALQLMRNLGLGSYKTAWFMSHRIRFAMKCEPMTELLKGDVQVDETYVGGKPSRKDRGKAKKGRGTKKTPVVALVETNGNVHSRPVADVSADTLKSAMEECVDPKATIVTDEFPSYPRATAGFAAHEQVYHSYEEYVNPKGYHTNTAESYFALLKRGVHGSFHHVSKHHLHRYCDEFSFRWNGRFMTDADRRDEAIRGADGKRLMFREPTA